MQRQLIIGCLTLLVFPVLATGGNGRVLPTEQCDQYFMVPLAFGDTPEETLLMLFDTGASHTIVDPDALERVSGKRVRTGNWARIAELKVGPVTMSRLRARVKELDHLERALGGPLDGILGFPVFEDVLLTLDYAAGEIRVKKGSLGKADGVEIFDLDRKERKRPWIPVRIGGLEKVLLIDSGSNSYLSLGPWKTMEWISPPQEVNASMHINRFTVYEVGRLAEDMIFAGSRVEKPIVKLTHNTELLGAQVLKHFQVTFDQRNRRVRFRRQGNGPIRMEPVRGTGAVFQPKRDGLKIVHIAPGSPAEEAGLRKGDLVTAVDGRPYKERSCGGRLTSPDPEEKRIVFTIVRDDTPWNLTVPVVELVP